MDKPKYNIGDVVWIGEWKAREYWAKCPDCGGTKTLKVILFDGTEYIIPCETCKCGWEPSCGVVRSHRYEVTAEERIIQGLELGCYGSEKGVWQYSVGYNSACYRQVPETEIFLTEQEALNFALAKGRQLAIEQDARIFMKEKPAHSWAWHVTYYRREIKNATATIERAEKLLGIAKEKANAQRRKSHD